MRISPYLYPCCSVSATRFSNLTKFECSHRRAAKTYTHDIFHDECKRPHHATWKIWNLCIENKYHHLTLENKFRLLLNKGVHFHWRKSIWKCLENGGLFVSGLMCYSRSRLDYFMGRDFHGCQQSCWDYIRHKKTCHYAFNHLRRLVLETTYNNQ